MNNTCSNSPQPLDYDSITAMLESRAVSDPHTLFVRTAQGSITYAQARRQSAILAAQLQARGVTQDTPVVLFMKNSIEQVVLWFALARLRAIHVPINTALIGDRLTHVFSVTAARIVVVDQVLLAPLVEVLPSSGGVDTVIVNGAWPDAVPRHEAQTLYLTDLMAGQSEAPVVTGDELSTATLLFTSGTTGVSKACMLSHRYLAKQGVIHARQFGLRADDVLYCPFPLFHIDAATLTVVAALSVGGTAAIGERFSATRFWGEVTAFNASVFNFMGATLSILWKRDPSPDDRRHRVRLAWGVPMPEWKAQWEVRFGFPLYQLYGLTDAGVPAYDPIDGTQRIGPCGRVVDPFELRIDAASSVPPGDSTDPDAAPIGEILVRSREPGLTMNGYYKMPTQTAQTIDPEGWVHTGDLGSLDRDGFLTFHGRLSDSIRRRGENISAYEVEQIIDSHPAVLESSAIGIKSELMEEDVMVYVVLKERTNLSERELYDHCKRVAPAFMIPRYIEVVGSLPKTPTQKVEKFKLKALGKGPSTFDAEQ